VTKGVNLVLWIIALAVGVFIFACDVANAATPEDFNRVSTVFAMRPTHIECRTVEQDAYLFGAWGYTQFGWDYAVLDNELCLALENPDTTEPKTVSLAVMVLVHESYHLRTSWKFSAREGKVECKAIRHFRYGRSFLGLTEAQAPFQYALQAHNELVSHFPQYRSGCVVPS